MTFCLVNKLTFCDAWKSSFRQLKIVMRSQRYLLDIFLFNQKDDYEKTSFRHLLVLIWDRLGVSFPILVILHFVYCVFIIKKAVIIYHLSITFSLSSIVLSLLIVNERTAIALWLYLYIFDIFVKNYIT